MSQWDCPAIARELVASKLVANISASSVRRILAANRLQPWRTASWLSTSVPHDAAYAALVRAVVDLYTRPLLETEMVLCVDEKTNLQPRSRTHPTRPARPGEPVLVENEYARGGAVNLFAAFDTRKGEIFGRCFGRKRAAEFTAFLDELDAAIPATITIVHVVLDNLRVHKGKVAQAWLAAHPRFRFHHPPVHCSWLNQIEQWFAILQRKALAIADFADLAELTARILTYIEYWNARAHPFRWTSASADRALAKCVSNPHLEAA